MSAQTIMSDPVPAPLTPEEAVAVALATIRESWPPRRWPKGWAARIGKPESWMWLADESPAAPPIPQEATA